MSSLRDLQDRYKVADEFQVPRNVSDPTDYRQICSTHNQPMTQTVDGTAWFCRLCDIGPVEELTSGRAVHGETAQELWAEQSQRVRDGLELNPLGATADIPLIHRHRKVRDCKTVVCPNCQLEFDV
jgi:hypothetical protein